MIGRVVGLLALAVLAAPSLASATLQDEQALAQRFAPSVQLVAQAHECGTGESYEPIDVDALFDEPTVALRGPWGGGDLVKIAPSASDLTAARYEYHLDFPGNALHPGCDYERWARLVTAGTSPAVYAHVATDALDPGKLALQYWFYYVFNDWNNTHEGDWEMIQLDFDAANAHAALSRTPTSVGYSQHEGAERAAWDDPKLELVDGTHPVVHPAAGSHANFFGEALYVGSSASEGVGCDDTRGPTVTVAPVVKTIPTDPAAARRAFPWIAFTGRWGELQRAFFNGPTGPNLKEQWTEPFRWSADWRDRSIAVPAAGALGTGATDFFCGAVAAGSNGLRRSVEHPLPSLVAPCRVDRARRVRALADDVAARRTAAARAPAGVGSDPRGVGADVRQARVALPRHRRRCGAGLDRRDPAARRAARRLELPRHRDGRRARRGPRLLRAGDRHRLDPVRARPRDGRDAHEPSSRSTTAGTSRPCAPTG